MTPAIERFEGDVDGVASFGESGGPSMLGLNVGDTVLWLVLAAVLMSGLFVLNYVLLVRPTLESRVRNQRRWVMLASTIVVLVALVLTLPIPNESRVAILQVVGLAVTALITLSSTTIAANMMAGLMIGRVGAFRPGDFIRIFGAGGETFGRVTARGLFHVEIQSEERDLMTVPNSYMITHPVRTVRLDGTIVTCELSLGYDVPHGKIETLLAKAVEKAGLTDAYVQIRELGDFSVTYRAAGFLSDVKSLLTARSRLRAAILDTLHGAGIEIVSPTFMNQRRVEEPVIAERSRKDPMAKSAFESMIFDKAEDAERVERVREALEKAKARVKELETQLSEADADAKDDIKSDIEHQKELVAYLVGKVNDLESSGGGGGES